MIGNKNNWNFLKLFVITSFSNPFSGEISTVEKAFIKNMENIALLVSALY